MEANGSCHCGTVVLYVPSTPEWVVQCGCSICKKTGVLWAYYPDNAVRVNGETETYTCNNEIIGFHRCTICGCVTHWKTLGKDFGRMAVNARLLEGIDLNETQVRAVDGPTPTVFADNWPPDA